MPDDDKENRDRADIGIEFFKELTVALISQRQAIALLTNTIREQMAQTALLIESIQELDHHVTGVSFMASRWNYVFDKLLEVHRGDPAADPPVVARVPELRDLAAALQEFDEEAEKAAAEADEEEKELEELEEPEKAPMLTSAPKAPKLQKSRMPLPKVEPLGR